MSTRQSPEQHDSRGEHYEGNHYQANIRQSSQRLLAHDLAIVAHDEQVDDENRGEHSVEHIGPEHQLDGVETQERHYQADNHGACQNQVEAFTLPGFIGETCGPAKGARHGSRI